MENHSERRRLQKHEMNGTRKSLDFSVSLFRSKSKKDLSGYKYPQSEISGSNEHQGQSAEEHSPYAASFPLVNRLYALKNPRKYQPGMVGDRVMSAKLIKMKELENELTVLRKQLNEANAENKMLQALQHRQDHALKKFEGAKSQLSQLIQSHSEEVRALKAKCKKESLLKRDLEKRLKNREMELRALHEQNRHLLQLSKDRNLEERAILREEVDTLKNMLQHLEVQFQEVFRRKAIEKRIHQQQLQQKINLNKELKKSLLTTEQSIHELKSLLLKNGIPFDAESIPNALKSPKEVKKVVASEQRLPLIGQQQQLAALEAVKDPSLTSMSKITNNKQKPCSTKIDKSGVTPRDPYIIGDKKLNVFKRGSGDEGEIRHAYERMSNRTMKTNVQESYFTSDDFYLSLDTDMYMRGNDAKDPQEKTTKSPTKGSKDSLKEGNLNNSLEVPLKSQGATELVASDEREDESSNEGCTSPILKCAQELDRKEILNSERTVNFCDEGKSKLDNSEVHDEEGIVRSKKDKLLQALRDIDQQEWTEISTSDDDGETEKEASAVNLHVKPVRKKSHSFGKGKSSSDRSCSSGSSSAKSKKSTTLRNSAKPDLQHELFGTIPKSEFKLNEKKTSEPTIPMLRDIKS